MKKRSLCVAVAVMMLLVSGSALCYAGTSGVYNFQSYDIYSNNVQSSEYVYRWNYSWYGEVVPSTSYGQYSTATAYMNRVDVSNASYGTVLYRATYPTNFSSSTFLLTCKNSTYATSLGYYELASSSNGAEFYSSGTWTPEGVGL